MLSFEQAREKARPVAGLRGEVVAPWGEADDQYVRIVIAPQDWVERGEFDYFSNELVFVNRATGEIETDFLGSDDTDFTQRLATMKSVGIRPQWLIDRFGPAA